MSEINRSDSRYVEILTVMLVAGQTYRTESQCLLEEQILSLEKSLTLRAGTGKLTFFKIAVQDLRPRLI
jgi:hypothetical protein